ncbi:MAG: ABC transporter permease [Candidatus Eiseniibacteriota bacterium]|nr:MAG: ABC transporter permease [Candidatus Eisenbacteria bacterium]
MRRIVHMTQKEFRQVFRDKPMVAIIFAVPIVQLFILAFAITTEVKHTKLMVVDYDRSTVSKDLVLAFVHTDRFDLAGHTTDLREVREGMRGWEVQMGLVIPAGFGADLVRGLKPQVQVVSDGVDGNSSGIATGYAHGILAGFGADYAAVQDSGAPPAGLSSVRMEERMWYNPDLSSQQFMVPGIVVVLLTILPMMLSAMSLVKEKEIGTMEQLSVTPLRKHQLLAGKLIPFLFLSYVELAIVTTVAVLIFRIPMNGSYMLLALLALLYLFATLGLGIFISTITRSQQQAMFVAWFFMVFMIMMSGFFIPIENMPPVLQKLTHLNTMRYFMSIIRDIFQKGSSLPFLLRDVVPLAAFGLTIFSVSVLAFRKRVG